MHADHDHVDLGLRPRRRCLPRVGARHRGGPGARTSARTSTTSTTPSATSVRTLVDGDPDGGRRCGGDHLVAGRANAAARRSDSSRGQRDTGRHRSRPSGPTSGDRRRDRRPRRDHERDARPVEEASRASDELRRRRLTRAANTAGPDANRARGRALPTGATPSPGSTASSRRSSRLQALVEDLLHLASADAGGLEYPPGPGRPRRHRAARGPRSRETRTRHIDTSGVSAAHLVGDPAQLLRVVRNLTDNAARHAAGTVVLRLTEEPVGVRLEVADDGPARRSRPRHGSSIGSPGSTPPDVRRRWNRSRSRHRARDRGASRRPGHRSRAVIPAGLVFVVELPVGPAPLRSGPDRQLTRQERVSAGVVQEVS